MEVCVHMILRAVVDEYLERRTLHTDKYIPTVHTVDKKKFTKIVCCSAVQQCSNGEMAKRNTRFYPVHLFQCVSVCARVPLPLSLIGVRYNMEVANALILGKGVSTVPKECQKSCCSRPQSSLR